MRLPELGLALGMNPTNKLPFQVQTKRGQLQYPRKSKPPMAGRAAVCRRSLRHRLGEWGKPVLYRLRLGGDGGFRQRARYCIGDVVEFTLICAHK
ncbi:MAG: hypothetical protein ACI9W2_001684 [Gammaproteobacteria bacterium]|jgi:hypothetical protein